MPITNPPAIPRRGLETLVSAYIDLSNALSADPPLAPFDLELVCWEAWPGTRVDTGDELLERIEALYKQLEELSWETSLALTGVQISMHWPGVLWDGNNHSHTNSEVEEQETRQSWIYHLLSRIQTTWAQQKAKKEEEKLLQEALTRLSGILLNALSHVAVAAHALLTASRAAEDAADALRPVLVRTMNAYARNLPAGCPVPAIQMVGPAPMPFVQLRLVSGTGTEGAREGAVPSFTRLPMMPEDGGGGGDDETGHTITACALGKEGTPLRTTPAEH